MRGIDSRMHDPSMDIALSLASGLGPAPDLPASLNTISARAKLVNDIDGTFVPNGDVNELVRLIGQRVKEIIEKSANRMPDVRNPVARLNICLRLWAGCLDAAKTIDLRTRSGPNTPEQRAELFSTKIDIISSEDPLYRAGVEAAPTIKDLRNNQPYCLEGVPPTSPVRRYVTKDAGGQP